MSIHRQAAVVAAVIATTGGFVALGTGPSEAAAVPTPPETGCTAAMDMVLVSDLLAQGYNQIAQFDQNGDGYICVKPVSPALQEKICADIPGGCTVPIIYWLRDNDLPARK